MNGARPYILAGLWVLLMIGLLFPMPYPSRPRREAPVLAQDFTTDASVPWQAFRAAVGGIPDPGPNQKSKCDPDRSEVKLNGGCWVKTDHPLPCPEGKQWAHNGACWLPVATAKPLPQSGGRGAGPVAE